MKEISPLPILRIYRFPMVLLILMVMLNISCSRSKSSDPSGGPTLVNYSGTFVASGGQDSTKAGGTVKATFSSSTRVLTYSITWSSLSSNPVAMHFHDDGPVIVTLSGFPVSKTGSLDGTATLTPSQVSDLSAGLIYAMIHTEIYSAGEIQATLVKQ
ncbi:MAG TPA: CHRD domain-containing protein [Puia sp.]|jgi:hypothetical protein